VFLGDYIDRGPDSAGVIETVRELQTRSPDAVVALKGNHEDLMVMAPDDPLRVHNWLYNGGDATLQSFGVPTVREVAPDVMEWARDLPTFHEDKRRYYVHAGLDPQRALSEQTDYDRLWMKRPFLDAEHNFGKHVVHGHTPQRDGTPERRYRTNLDTAAVYGGALTAGVFTDEQDRAVAYLRVRAGRTE
jgi:serine/threonine protein phosphatase 1